jgi:hypothetical protein
MKKSANIFLVLSSVFIFSGILFLNMHWPGGSILTLAGTVFSLVGMLFYFIARFKNKSNVKVATYSVYFYFFVMVVGTGYYSAIATGKDLLNGFYDVNHKMEKSNESLITLLNKPTTEGMKLYKNIEKHKLTLISGGGTYSSKEDVLNFYCDQNKIPLYQDNQDIAARYFLIQNFGKNGTQLVEDLKKIRSMYAFSLGEDYPHLVEDVNKEKQEYGFTVPWINALCEYIPMIAVLPKLTIIQNQILHCELALKSTN